MFQKAVKDYMRASASDSSCSSFEYSPAAQPRSNKTKIIWIGVAVLVILAVVYYYKQSGSGSGKAVFGSASPYSVEETTDLDDTLSGNDRPMALLLHATWCGHCRELLPLFQDAAKELGGKMRFCSCENDVLTKSRRSENLQVQGFPTVVAISTDGRVLDRLVGNRGKDALMQFLKKYAN
jgi:thiol-disulfide isomerase/thioredoxin